MNILTGQFEQTIDSKKRTVIPSQYRSFFAGNTIILFPRPNKCLSVYNTDEYEKMILRMEEKVEKAETREEAEELIQKIKNISSNSITIVFDGAGRFTVPEKLISHAQLVTDVIVLGCVKTLEIWSKEKYEESNYIAIEDLTMDDVPQGLL